MTVYKVVTDTNLISFETSVKTALTDGYTLVGGISITSRPDGVTLYAQALAK